MSDDDDEILQTKLPFTLTKKEKCVDMPTPSFADLIKEGAKIAPLAQDSFWQLETEEPDEVTETVENDLKDLVVVGAEEEEEAVNLELNPLINVFTNAVTYPASCLKDLGFSVQQNTLTLGTCPPLSQIIQLLDTVSYTELLILALDVNCQRILAHIKRQLLSREPEEEIDLSSFRACQLVHLTRLTGNLDYALHILERESVTDLKLFFSTFIDDDYVRLLRVSMACCCLPPPPVSLLPTLEHLIASIPRTHQMVHIACLRYVARLHTHLRLLNRN